jgi:serine/threonine protein phosphatase 1
MNAANVWNVDTGVAFYGKLTGMNVDTKTYYQSDLIRTLYPNEKGRNPF